MSTFPMLPSIENLNLADKKVLMRVDFNVPINEAGQILDDSRLKAALDSIQDALKKGASVILISHLGRPKGVKKEVYSLKKVLKRLQELLGQSVLFEEDCIGPKVQEVKKNLKKGQVLLLENLRFHLAEEKPKLDPDFAKELALHCDSYINEAFSCSHRFHSSITEITKYFKECAFGFEHLKELEAYQHFLKTPKRPFVALIAGAKISSKIGPLKALLDKVDILLVAGAMAHTFLSALGYEVGRSLKECDYEKEALMILKAAKEKKVDLLLPKDLGVIQEENAPIEYTSIRKVSKKSIAVDIGPQTIEEFKKVLSQAATLFWNGPLGVFEKEASSKGTLAIAQFLAELKGVTFIGGGDSTAALKKAGVLSQMTFISTGGGATLELIEKGTLPGAQAIIQANLY